MISNFLKSLLKFRTKTVLALCVFFFILWIPSTREFLDFTAVLDLNTDKLERLQAKQSFKKPLKIALWLNPKLGPSGLKYRHKFVHERIIGPQSRNDCFNCNGKCEMSLSHDNMTLKEADAIIFIEFAHPFTMNDLPPNWKNWRGPNQIWAVLIEESPINRGTNRPPVFNWTISYRRDSEIWSPYGRIYGKDKPENKIMMGPSQDIPLSKWITSKSKLVTSAISNCKTNSKRHLIVKKLIDTGKQVDIYGSCGNVKDGKRCGYYTRNCTSFWNSLAAEYKFYLAFENSLCEDYVTEKFWRSLKLGMVPVVYGGGNYKEIAPSESYIDVNWFKKGDDLIDYLESVGGNATEYKKFFKWRKNFDVVKEDKAGDLVWCELCRKLRDLKNKQEKGIRFMYQVPVNWWSGSKNASKFVCTSFDKFLKWV